MQNFVKVGVGVLVYNSAGKVLLMKRAGAYGAGTWAPPGGHVEFGETAVETARREVKEETGIDIGNIEVVGFTEDIVQSENNHYITIWLKSDWLSGELKSADREFSEIGLFDLKNPPTPLFVSFKNFTEGKILP
jgi:8-oxo-dGTP diphosphatase